MEKTKTTPTNKILNDKSKQVIIDKKENEYETINIKHTTLDKHRTKGLQAQVATPASGGNASGSGGIVSYTVGQVVYNTNSGTNGSVSQGVQQPYEISVISGIDEGTTINLVCSAYPNPTTDFLTLKIESFEKEKISYQIFDINGKLLSIRKVEGKETSIDMKNLMPAIYFVKVMDNNKEVKTFKIIKN